MVPLLVLLVDPREQFEDVLPVMGEEEGGELLEEAGATCQ